MFKNRKYLPMMLGEFLQRLEKVTMYFVLDIVSKSLSC